MPLDFCCGIPPSPRLHRDGSRTRAHSHVGASLAAGRVAVAWQETPASRSWHDRCHA